MSSRTRQRKACRVLHKKFFDRLDATVHQGYRPALRPRKFQFERYAQSVVNRRGNLSRCGRPIFWRGANVAVETPLYTAEPIGKGSTMRRAVDGVSELVIGVFRAGAEKL